MNIPWVPLTIRLVIVIAIFGGLYMLHIQVLAARESYQLALAELEETPRRLLEAASRAAELSRREFDISRIRRQVVQRDQIVEVVGAIEAEAGKYNVEVSVPEIVEAEEPSLIEDITLQVSIDGKPSDIIDFAHTVEHLPYLVTLKSFSFSTRSFAVPQTSLRAPDDRVSSPVGVEGHGELTLIVAVTNPTHEKN